MIDDLIRLIMKHSAEKADPSVISLELLEAAWPTLVGVEMARRTRPRAWGDGTLHIDVSSHAWVQELSFHREELLGRIKRVFPWRLERLHLSVAERFEPLERRELLGELDVPRPELVTKPPRQLDEEAEREAHEALAHLDPETREVMLRIRGHIQKKS